MKRTILLLTFISALCASTAAIAEFTMAYGLPIYPDARLAVSDAFDSPEVINNVNVHNSTNAGVYYGAGRTFSLGLKVKF